MHAEYKLPRLANQGEAGPDSASTQPQVALHVTHSPREQLSAASLKSINPIDDLKFSNARPIQKHIAKPQEQHTVQNLSEDVRNV